MDRILKIRRIVERTPWYFYALGISVTLLLVLSVIFISSLVFVEKSFSGAPQFMHERRESFDPTKYFREKDIFVFYYRCKEYPVCTALSCPSYNMVCTFLINKLQQ